MHFRKTCFSQPLQRWVKFWTSTKLKARNVNPDQRTRWKTTGFKHCNVFWNDKFRIHFWIFCSLADSLVQHVGTRQVKCCVVLGLCVEPFAEPSQVSSCHSWHRIVFWYNRGPVDNWSISIAAKWETVFQRIRKPFPGWDNFRSAFSAKKTEIESLWV